MDIVAIHNDHRFPAVTGRIRAIRINKPVVPIRQLPAVLLTDYFVTYVDGTPVLYADGQFDNADIRNSIIYGSQSMELLIDSYYNQQLSYSFDHCLTRIHEDSSGYLNDPLITNILNNQNPLFDSIPVSYELDSLSPAIDAGLPSHAIPFPFDLHGNSRLDDIAPDLGAYERIDP